MFVNQVPEIILSTVTDTPEGIMYCVVTDETTTPSHVQIKAGQDFTGNTALWSGSVGVTASPVELFPSGLPSATSMYAHFSQENASLELVISSQLTSNVFTIRS